MIVWKRRTLMLKRAVSFIVLTPRKDIRFLSNAQSPYRRNNKAYKIRCLYYKLLRQLLSNALFQKLTRFWQSEVESLF